MLAPMVVPFPALPLPRAASVELIYTNATAPVAFRIARLRMRARVSRHELAVKIDSTDAFIERLEHGGPGITRDRVRRVATALRMREELFYPSGRPDLFWNEVDHKLAEIA